MRSSRSTAARCSACRISGGRPTASCGGCGPGTIGTTIITTMNYY